MCERIASGDSLATICAEPGMPSYPTVKRWLLEDSQQDSSILRAMYARAREIQADFYADKMADIAKKTRPDFQEIGRSKLEIDTLKWIASKMRPQKYGDRQFIDQTIEAPKAVNVYTTEWGTTVETTVPTSGSTNQPVSSKSDDGPN